MSAEAWKLIRESAHYRRAGTIDSAFIRYRGANPGETAKLLAYMDALIRGQSPSPPQLATLFGRGFAQLLASTSAAPSPQPEPEPIIRRINGAFLDTAGDADPALLLSRGITHVAVEMTAENFEDFKPGNRSAGKRWHGFQAFGGLYMSRGAPSEEEMDEVADACHENLFSFLCCDTESHKTDMGGSLLWTSSLYHGLRHRLGPSFPIRNVTFGRDQSPAVFNHAALRSFGIAADWETYDGNGFTQGVAQTVAKIWTEGWKPVNVVLGTKSLHSEIPEAKRLRNSEGTVGDIWLWAADHGPSQDALRSGLSLA